LLLALFGIPGFGQNTSTDDFRSLQADAGKVVSELPSFQGLDGPPSPVMAGLPDLIQRYHELRVNQVRTHDFMGPTEYDSKFDQQFAVEQRCAHCSTLSH
jgi:hypothetical protein